MTTLDLRPTTEYFRFSPPRRCEEYMGQAGSQSGLLLPPEGYQAVAEAKATGEPTQFLVIGEWRRSDGARFLDLGINPAWIAERTNYRPDPRGVLRWTCPVCGRLSGKHDKSCDYE